MSTLRQNTPVTIDASTLLSLLAAASNELSEMRTAWVDTECVKEARKLKRSWDYSKARFDIALDAYIEATREEEE